MFYTYNISAGGITQKEYKSMSYGRIELLVIYSNTWNHLSKCNQMINSK